MVFNASSGIFALIGSYAEASETGLYSCSFAPETGELTLLDQVSGLLNPTFLTVHEEQMKVYTLLAERDDDNRRVGAVAAYRIDRATGRLVFLNKQRTVDAPTCHITLDHTRRFLMDSSYHGGVIGLSPVMDDGKVGPIADVHRREGSSVHPAQTQSRLHSAFLDPTNRFVMVSDLGADQIVIYALDVEKGKLNLHGVVNLKPGAGPRHFAFHPVRNFGYVINELNSTITAFRYDRERGALEEIQTVSTLPAAFGGDNACADIHISPDGKFLYGSNRGHDSIAVYAIGPDDGKLVQVEVVSTQGQHPRNFAISPDGRFLLVANRDTNEIVTFARNQLSGQLKPTGFKLAISKPVCIKFLGSRDIH